MSNFLICLNHLSYSSNLLKITYYLNNKFLLLEPSPVHIIAFTAGVTNYGTVWFIRAFL